MWGNDQKNHKECFSECGAPIFVAAVFGQTLWIWPL